MSLMIPQRRVARALAPGLLLLACASGPAPAVGATAYISDELTVPLRHGATPQDRILRILPAGIRLEVRERDPATGYALVTLQDGTEGWVPLQYLVDQPIARDRLEAANREVDRLAETVTELRARLESAQGIQAQAAGDHLLPSNDVLRLEQELSEIRRASANALDTAAANQRLTELNARLRDELNLLVEERDRLAASSQQRWLLIGGGLVLAGLVLGMILKARPRRSAWS